MSISRRTLLGTGAALGAVALTGTGTLEAFAKPPVRPGKSGGVFGPLTTIVDDGKLALPRGFTANRVTTIDVEPLLNDRGGAVIGRTPSNLDGTGAFDVQQRIRLIVNHECRANARVTVPLVPGTVYDAGVPSGMGGNTVVEVEADGTFVQQWVGLSGTIRNCAGGETPWGTWLSCEEDTTKKGTTVTNRAGQTYTTQQDHGYVFEVFPDVVAAQVPEPIKAWGRAVWEGAAIGPQRHDAYLTEDTGGGLFYRWTAPKGTVIKAGIARQFGENDGVLQAAQLVKNGRPLVHYGELSAADLNRPYPVIWIDGGADRQAQRTDLRKQYPGATVHPKIEGCWSDGKGLWFTLSYTNASQATQYGIDTDSGMIMFYDFKAQTLTLKEYYATGNPEGFHGPDNITVSPFGTVMIAEDGDNPCSLISFTPAQGSQEFARDLADRGEWAGPVFGDKGRVLFGSIQSDCTYAITGPFQEMLGRR